jgi:hypothetical protein
MRARPHRRRVSVLWCGNARSGRANGWSFPARVERHLRTLTAGKTVLQQFGGLARWGVKVDIDPLTRPHVLADAWLLPFVKNAFDVVIIDPPYHSINQQMKQQLLRAAAYVARERVIWFHTQWIASDSLLRLERAWLVRVGDSCACRCVQVFNTPRGEKRRPRNYFSRGPAIKYNRWLRGELKLPFEAVS